MPGARGSRRGGGPARNNAVGDALSLAVLLVGCVLTGRWLVGDLRAHPANSPDPLAR